MIYGLYQSAAGMLTNEYRQQVLSNNLANADTVGFKRDVVSFAERLPAWEASERGGPSERGDPSERGGPSGGGGPSAGGGLGGGRYGPRDRLLDPLTGGVWLARTETDHTEGPQAATGNWSDLALEGPGFFVVQVAGKPQYTRDGRFLMDAGGQLVSAIDGSPVAGRGGQWIQLDPRGGTPSIDTLGRVWQDGGTRGVLEIVDFPDYRVLQKAGATRFVGPPDKAVASGALVHNGVVENSGTEPVRELVDMMSAGRAYLINARMVSLQDQTLSRLISSTVMA